MGRGKFLLNLSRILISTLQLSGSTKVENLAVVERMGVFGDACRMDGVVHDLVHRLYPGIRMENGGGQRP